MLSGGGGRFDDELEGARGSSTRLEPLPLMAERGRQAEYPVDALGPVLGPAVEATVRHAMVPPSIAAQSTLAAVSLAVQGHFDVQLPTGKVRPTTLHLVSVAESGDRKSTSDDFVMQPIWQYQEHLEERYELDSVSVGNAQAAWDETRKSTINSLKGKGQDALKAALDDLGKRPESPLTPVIVVRSGTTQALLKRFTDHRPSLGLMSDEGGSWLGGYGMTEDNRLLTISTLSDFWDGQTVQINTASEGFTALRGRRLTFHIMIQPVLSARLLGNAEAQGQGFLSRLLVAAPESLAGTRFVDPDRREAPEDQHAIASYRERLSRIIAAPLPADPETNILKPRAVPFSPEARAMWWAFYNSIEKRLGPDGDLTSVKGFVGKLPEQAARLAAVIGVFEAGIRITEIDAQMLARGIRLAEFYLSEAVRLFGQDAPRTEIEDAKALSDWLRDSWRENLVSITAISQNVSPTRLRQGADYIRGLLEVLERHDHVVKLPDGGMVGGKKVRQAWRVVRSG